MPGFKFVSWIATGGRRGAHSKQDQRPPERKPGQLGTVNDGAKRSELSDELKPGWFYWKLGRLKGPFNDAELFDLLDKGDLEENSLVALMNVPLATLLRDPAKRFDFQTKVHLKKPSQGVEYPPVTSPDREKHERATIPAEKSNDIQNSNVTAWLRSNQVGATKFTEDLAAAQSKQDDDKASHRVDNSSSSKKFLQFTVDPGDADESTSTGSSTKSHRVDNNSSSKKSLTFTVDPGDAESSTSAGSSPMTEFSEVDGNAHTDRSGLTPFKVGSRVRCKDQGENWQRGVVISVSPLLVKPDGFHKGFPWDDVEFEAEGESSEIDRAMPRKNEVRHCPSKARSAPSNTVALLAFSQRSSMHNGCSRKDSGVREKTAVRPGSSKAPSVPSKIAAGRRVGQTSAGLESQIAKLKAMKKRHRKDHKFT